MRPSVRKKDGGYQLLLSYKSNGKWKQKAKQGFKSESEAYNYLPELVAKIKKKEIIDDDLENILVLEYLEIYLEDKSKEVRKGTLKNKKNALKYLEPIYNKKMADVTYYDLKNITSKMELADVTAHRYISAIKAFFAMAKKPYRIISENPAEDIKLPKVARKEMLTLTSVEILDLLDKIRASKTLNKDDIYLATLIMANTGIRIGEAHGLKWEDIDLENKIIHINKQYDNGFKELKTEQSKRSIPLPDTTAKTIEYFKTFVIYPSEKRVFIKYNHSAAFSSACTKAYKRAGYNITPHKLRHSYATILLSNGVDIKTVASLLGDNVQTVIETYIHYDDQMRKNAKTKLNEIFKI